MNQPLTIHGNPHASARILLMGCLALLTISAMGPILPAAHAQAGVVTATPGTVNLGMSTSIAVTANAPGTLNVAVQAPNGATSSLAFTFTSTGQTLTQVYGNLTSGWGVAINQVGAYSVIVYQGTTVVGSTSFYSTNQILISTDFITAGYCLFVASGSRGQELLFQVHATYASNGAPIAASTAAVTANGDKVTYTLPDGTTATASFHASSPTTWAIPWFQGHVWGTWNTSWVGTYTPSVTVTDSFGNKGSLNTATNGYAFIYSPATLQQSIALTDSAGKTVAGLTNAQNVTITANVAYLVTPTAIGAVAGFNGPLDTATRGGVVTALVGWGFYNTTSGSFGSAKQPGGLVTTVPLTYSTTSKTWSGTFSTGTLPTLVNATAYSVILSSHDKATPPNTGFNVFSVSPASSLSNAPGGGGSTGAGTTSTTTVTAPASTVTATTTSVSTAVSTTTAVSTAVSTVSSIVSSISTATTTTVSIAVSTLIQTAAEVPDWAYVIMALLIIVGGLSGYVFKGSGGKK